MKKVKYFLFMIIALGVFSVVKAENINVSDIVSKFQAESGYEVTYKADGTSFIVNTGAESVEYSFTGNDNILSYNVGVGKSVKDVVQADKVLGYIVELSSNREEYKQAKDNNSSVSAVSYGSGCDLTNMGFCYDSTTGRMQVVMNNQFTTYLYNYYSGNTAQSIPGETSRNSIDPIEGETTGDSKNPDTGTFTETGIIVGLLALLLLVINLKRHSETEFKI